MSDFLNTPSANGNKEPISKTACANTAPIKENGYSVFYKKTDADFKILLITDSHVGCGFFSHKTDALAEAARRRTAQKAKADLIIVNGDLTYPIFIFSGTNNNRKEAEHVSAIMESLNTPWTFVFGNHDQERHSRYDKNTLADTYLKGSNCLFQKGPSNIDGVGNHIIKIKNSDGSLNNALVFLDSNMYLGRGFLSGFDHVHDNQIAWYRSEIIKLSKEYGGTIPSLMFFHIPIKEFFDAWKLCYLGSKDVLYHCGFVGEKDNYFGYPKTLITHIFDDVLDLESTKGIFMGHDHLNTLSLTYKGIRLTYPMSIDYLAYTGIKKKTTQRGGTLIKIDNSGKFTIKHLPLTDA